MTSAFDDFDDDIQQPSDTSLLNDLVDTEEVVPEEDTTPAAQVRRWLDGKRGWLVIIAATLAQALFVGIMLTLRTTAQVDGNREVNHIRSLAVEMLGHEVKLDGIYQILPMRGGNSMTVGLELVLVLGQLPEERVDGAVRPTGQEMELFVAVLGDMEPSIRSRVNGALQRVPPEDLGTAEVLESIRAEVRDYVNDTLDTLNFGGRLRQGIGKRRVTDVLIPMYIRQKN